MKHRQNPEPSNTPPPGSCIAEIRLDESRLKHSNPIVEQEKQVALSDLVRSREFTVLGYEDHKPYFLFLTIEDGRLILKVQEETTLLESISVPLKGFRRIIYDYFLICDSYYAAAQEKNSRKLQSIDMGRRGLHNEGADLLQELLKDKITLDKDTARRVFTLICVLHVRNTTV